MDKKSCRKEVLIQNGFRCIFRGFKTFISYFSLFFRLILMGPICLFKFIKPQKIPNRFVFSLARVIYNNVYFVFFLFLFFVFSQFSFFQQKKSLKNLLFIKIVLPLHSLSPIFGCLLSGFFRLKEFIESFPQTRKQYGSPILFPSGFCLGQTSDLPSIIRRGFFRGVPILPDIRVLGQVIGCIPFLFFVEVYGR